MVSVFLKFSDPERTEGNLIDDVCAPQHGLNFLKLIAGQ
jgi:hypothetical protein